MKGINELVWMVGQVLLKAVERGLCSHPHPTLQKIQRVFKYKNEALNMRYDQYKIKVQNCHLLNPLLVTH